MDALFRPLIRWLARERAAVLVFHSVPAEARDAASGLGMPEAFGRVLDHLASVFEIVPLGEIMQRLVQGRPLGRLAAITLDDGYPDWPTVVAPMLRARGLPATLFITSAQLDGRPMWSERIAQLLRHGQPVDLSALHPALPAVDWRSPASREQAIEPLTAALKYLRLPFRDALIERLEQACGVPAARTPRFGIEDLRAVHALGFEIGAHTVDHPILSYCDEDEARREIMAVRERLCELVDAEVRYFAYPNGKPMADYSLRDIQLVQQAGYLGAVSTSAGTVRAGCSPFEVPRFSPWLGHPLQQTRELIGNLRRDGDQLHKL